MCGRFTQAKAIREYMDEVSPEWQRAPSESRPPTWNLTPTSLAWAIRQIDSAPSPVLLRWGFQRGEGASGIAPINARIESVAEKPLFRAAWEKQRCLVPADGWYEWKADGKIKQPYYFFRRDGHTLFFAGLWSNASFCLLTTAADGELAQVHHRKPVALPNEEASTWLTGAISHDKLLTKTLSASAIQFHPVNRTVSSGRVDGPELILPATISTPPRQEGLLF